MKDSVSTIVGRNVRVFLIHAVWDSIGTIRSTQVLKGKIENKLLDSVLTLKVAPTVSYGLNSRKCLLEADLTFIISSIETDRSNFDIKRVKGGFKLYTDYPEKIQSKIKEKLQLLDLTQNKSYNINVSERKIQIKFYSFNNSDLAYANYTKAELESEIIDYKVEVVRH